MSKILIIDMSFTYIKYFYASKYQNESKGMDTIHKRHIQGLIRFFSLIEKNNKEFTKIFVVLDCALRDTESKEMFEDYKAGRTKIEGIHKNESKFYSLISLIPRVTILRNNSREADDVIAYLAMKYGSNENNSVLIHSGDKDFLQLTAVPNINVSENYKNGKFLVLPDEEIFQKFKNSKKEDFTRISTDKYDILKYRVFKGDASDNIPPAIPRLRDKDIIYIIKNYWLENSAELLDEDLLGDIIATAHNDKVNPKLHDKIVASYDSILRNYKLMNLYSKIYDETIIRETKKVNLGSITKDDKIISKLVEEFELTNYLEMI